MTLTPFPTDSIDALMAKRIPSWLRQSSVDLLSALHRAMHNQQSNAHEVKALLAPVPLLDQFVQPKLASALRNRYGVDVDVRNAKLRSVKQVVLPPVLVTTPSPKYTEISTRPLLACALHNFTASEVHAPALTDVALIDARGRPIPIRYADFVRLCRELDLGGQYQAALRKQLALDQGAASQERQRVQGLMEEAQRLQLEVAVRLAGIKGEIDQQSFQQLMPVISATPIVPADPAQLRYRQLFLLGKRIEGVVVIEVREHTVGAALQGLIVWMPDDPVQAVQEFPSWWAFYQALALRLRDQAFVRYFARFIRERDRVGFFSVLNARQAAGGAQSAIELDGRDFAIDRPLFTYLQALRIDKILDDARVLAVPTGDEDAQLRASRLQGYKDAGLTLLNLAGLFVPVLGEVMLGVAAVQLAEEVYEGYQDWQLGDRQAALGHLFNVAQNILEGAVVAAGVAAAGQVLKRVAFVDELVPIRTDSGRLKLAAGDLAAYRVSDKATTVGERTRHDGQWQMRVHEGSFRLAADTDGEHLRIAHPQRHDAYRPMLEHNGAGGWRHTLEYPQKWTGESYLLRRLGSELADVSDDEARYLLQCTGFDEAQLRLLHAQNAPAPARLLDALQRHRLHQAHPELRDDAFEALFVSLQVGEQDAERQLRRDFAGLSLRGAKEIVQQTDSAQVEHMLETKRVPLAMAERVRWYLRDSRIDRACAGLQQAQAISGDTERLAVGLIDTLAPWSPSMRIEVREGSAQGPLLIQLGNEQATQVRCIVRGSTGYGVFEESGGLLATASASDSLQQALLMTMDEGQKLALGDQQLDVQGLTERLASEAARQREQVSTLIGQAPVGLGVRPPVRFADGRLGYPLSGHVQSRGQASRRGLQQIFPTLSDVQLQNYLLDLIARQIDPWEHYSDLHQQLSQLRLVLSQWRSRESGVLSLLRRYRVAATLRRCWRRKIGLREDGGYQLEIRGEQVGVLPSLPQGLEFSHVTHLTLRNMALAELQPDFLPRFTRLRQLDLRDNRLTNIPEGIEQLTDLRQLNLANNQIFMTITGNGRLQALTQLRVLDLSGNQLGRAPDTRQMVQLRSLDLSSTGLTRWPEGPQQVPWQGMVDLRANQIRQLNRENQALRRAIQRLSLHDNPLDDASAAYWSEASSARSDTHSGSQGNFALRHQLVQEADRERWLAGLTVARRQQREAQWQRLQAEPNSSGFFRFLRDFAHTDDFARHPSYYRGRVWQIVDACEQNSEVREQLFVLAAGRRTCEDRLLLVLSQMEVRELIHRYSTGVSAIQTEQPLMRVGRALFRLDEVDQIAARRIADIRARGLDVDDIEVYLSYRYRLATSLGLPGQPTTVHYEAYSGLTAADINNARIEVLRAESNERLAQSLAGQDFWKDYLRNTYEQQFTTLAEEYYAPLAQYEALASKGELQEEELIRLSAAQMNDYHAAERELILKLTGQAYERWPV